MSLEELKTDYAAITAKIQALNPALTTTGDIVSLLRNDIWPWLDNAVTEIDEMDGAIGDLVAKSEDILHEETAGIIAAPIVGARMIIAKYKASLPAGHEDLVAIKAWEKMASEAEETLAEIVVEDEDDDEDDEDDEEDEDEDGDEAEDEEE